MLVSTYKCDVCGATKKDANHWWVVWVDNEIFKIVSLSSWVNWRIKSERVYSHICGQACLSQALDLWQQSIIKEQNEKAH